MRSRFRPRLAPTLITLSAVLLCLALGAWQIQRLHWKEALIARRDAALAAAPAAPPETLEAAQKLDLHRVVAEGVFLHDGEELLHAIGPQGGIGFDVLTPFKLGGGKIVLVDRGFVPIEMRDRNKRRAGQPTAAVRVSGFVRLPPAAKPSWFTPDNKPAAHEWFWLDLPAVAAAAGVPDALPYTIEADATPNPDGWPKGRDALPALPNNHLQYAITWFSLAAAGLAIYVASQWHGADRDEPLHRT